MQCALTKTLAPICQHSQQVLVYRFRPELTTPLLLAAAGGARIVVFDTPDEFSRLNLGGCTLLGQTALEYFAQQPLFFDEDAYLQTYPDIAAAVQAGSFVSGYAHYEQFGQFEGREPPAGFVGGLAEYDTVIVHAADLADLVREFGGRFQTHHRILILSSDEPAPPGAATPVAGLAVYYTPPLAWLGVYQPARTRVHYGAWPHRLAPRETEGTRTWPRISIITPSFNQGRFLEATLRSLLIQGYPNLELIVIDGGSKDDSVDIIRRYAGRIAYWESEPDRGQSHAINKGMQRATGEILTWINSDDRLAPNALFTVAEMFSRHSPDLVVGRCARVMDPDPTPYHFHRCVLPLGQITPLPLNQLLQLDRCWLKGDFFHQPEVFFSRRIWETVGGRVDEDLYFSMDYDLWVRFAAAGATILSIPEVLAIFRQHPAQKTGGEEQPFLPELRRVNAMHRTRLRTSLSNITP